MRARVAASGIREGALVAVCSRRWLVCRTAGVAGAGLACALGAGGGGGGGGAFLEHPPIISESIATLRPAKSRDCIRKSSIREIFDPRYTETGPLHNPVDPVFSRPKRYRINGIPPNSSEDYLRGFSWHASQCQPRRGEGCGIGPGLYWWADLAACYC